MKDIFNKVVKSFTGKIEGFSSRKLTAFAIILVVIATHIKWLTLGDLSQMEMVLTIDYAFIASLFGMTTYSSLKTNKAITDTKKDIKEDSIGNGDESNI